MGSTFRSLCGKKKLTYKFYLHVLLLAVAFYGFINLAQQVALDGETFDPYSILNVDESANLRAIRKSYRTMSLKYHPDKVPESQKANAAIQFAKLAKAYKALTDPNGIDNYKKFGHPDGSNMFRAGVALPSFMFDERNQLAMMFFYLVLVIVLPTCLYFGCRNKTREDKLSFASKKVLTNRIEHYACCLHIL